MYCQPPRREEARGQLYTGQALLWERQWLSLIHIFMWKVANRDSGEMLFMMGGHPAFQVPEGKSIYDFTFEFNRRGCREGRFTDCLHYLAPNAKGYEKEELQGVLKLSEGRVPLTKEMCIRDRDNTVRIMSIHKSKGLEFPVVFLAGLGKRFNKQDAYGQILLDADLGAAADFLDLELRVKAPTLKKQALKRRTELETMGEELRVLYVAMTRAKEKLIMTCLLYTSSGPRCIRPAGSLQIQRKRKRCPSQAGT